MSLLTVQPAARSMPRAQRRDSSWSPLDGNTHDNFTNRQLCFGSPTGAWSQQSACCDQVRCSQRPPFHLHSSQAFRTRLRSIAYNRRRPQGSHRAPAKRRRMETATRADTARPMVAPIPVSTCPRPAAGFRPFLTWPRSKKRF